MKRWLVVEDAWAVRGGAVALEPKFVPDNPPRGEFEIELRLPSGETRRCKATLDFAHSRGTLPPFALVRALGMTPEEVPIGSEVWF
ncbi:MAG: hypothetical protein U0174_25645 [Polyangiaceae bacterium]